jgi:hypothetical protein
LAQVPALVRRLILHALRAAPADHGAAAHRLADVLAAEAALGERRRAPR